MGAESQARFFTPIFWHGVHQALVGLGHKRIQINQCVHAAAQSLGHASDHHAAITVATQNDVFQFFGLDEADHVLHMGHQIDLWGEQVGTIGQTRQSG
jgi:hypothetical protein